MKSWPALAGTTHHWDLVAIVQLEVGDGGRHGESFGAQWATVGGGFKSMPMSLSLRVPSSKQCEAGRNLCLSARCAEFRIQG